MKSGMTILIDNFTTILGLIIVITFFFIIYDKYFNKDNDYGEKFSEKEISEKNLYLNKIDSIGAKVGIIYYLILLIVASIIYFLIG